MILSDLDSFGDVRIWNRNKSPFVKPLLLFLPGKHDTTFTIFSITHENCYILIS